MTLVRASPGRRLYSLVRNAPPRARWTNCPLESRSVWQQEQDMVYSCRRTA